MTRHFLNRMDKREKFSFTPMFEEEFIWFRKSKYIFFLFLLWNYGCVVYSLLLNIKILRKVCEERSLIRYLTSPSSDTTLSFHPRFFSNNLFLIQTFYFLSHSSPSFPFFLIFPLSVHFLFHLIFVTRE